MILELGDVIAISNIVSQPIFGEKSIQLKKIFSSDEFQELHSEFVKISKDHSKLMENLLLEVTDKEEKEKIRRERMLEDKKSFGKKTISEDLSNDIKEFSLKYVKEVEEGKTSVIYDEYVIFSNLANQQ